MFHGFFFNHQQFQVQEMHIVDWTNQVVEELGVGNNPVVEEIGIANGHQIISTYFVTLNTIDCPI